MPNLGMSELIVILMILVLVFGGSRLPQLGESLGRTIRSFKRGIADNDDIEVERAPAAPAPAATASAPAKLEPPAKPASSATQDPIADAEFVEKKS